MPQENDSTAMRTIIVPHTSKGNAPVYPIEYHNMWNTPDSHIKASFAPSYDTEYLYIHFETTGPLRCENTADQSPVSQDSCVEFFIQPHNGGEYWNFEFNCGGALNASHRMTRPEPARLCEAELKAVTRHPDSNITPDANGKAHWTLDVAIPWALMDVTPTQGLTMRANAYACASKANPPYYLTFAPVPLEKPDFHRPEFFAELTLD